MLFISNILYYGHNACVVCDGQCAKAWGVNNRPRVQMSDDPDDFAFRSDSETGEAPRDPGTYEGGQAKPLPDSEDHHNKWCVRECERSVIVEGRGQEVMLPDFSGRIYNIPREEPTT